MIIFFNIYVDNLFISDYALIGDYMNNLYHLNKIYFGAPIKFDSLYLLQIGRMFCRADTVIDSHIHLDLFELTIVTDGEAEISTNDVPTRVKKGDIYLSYPGDIHKIVSNPEAPLKYDFFAFQLADEGFKRDFELIAADYASPNTRLFHNDRIRNLIGNAISEIDSELYCADELLNAIFKQIIIYVIRGFREINPRKNSANISDQEQLCHRIMNYIDTHIYSLKSLSELCSIIDYSYGYISSVFKKTTGNTLQSYFCDRRLDAARLLLLEGKLRITEISEMLSYASVYAFSKAFKEKYKVSPRAFKEDNKKSYS